MDVQGTTPHQPQRAATSTPIAVSDLRTAALGVARDGRIMNEEGAQITQAFREARERLGAQGFDEAFGTMLGQLTAERDGLPDGSDVHKQRDLALKMLYHVWNTRDVA